MLLPTQSSVGPALPFQEWNQIRRGLLPGGWADEMVSKCSHAISGTFAGDPLTNASCSPLKSGSAACAACKTATLWPVRQHCASAGRGLGAGPPCSWHPGGRSESKGCTGIDWAPTKLAHRLPMAISATILAKDVIRNRLDAQSPACAARCLVGSLRSGNLH